MSTTRTLKALGGTAVAAVLLWSAAAQALTQQEIADLQGPDRQKTLEDGAKKEGKVTIYSGMIVDQALQPITEAFMKKYPYIKAEFWRADSNKIIQKILAEARAKSIVADVAESTSLSEPLIKANVVVPFNSPSLDAYPADYRDPRRFWGATRFSYFGAAYNTKTVSAADAPKTYEDLLDPKWKGKMAWREGSDSGNLLFLTNIIMLMGDQKADEYFKKLSQQNIVNFTGSARTLVNRVIDGEYPIALNIFLHHPVISAQKGAPVAALPLEPVPSLNGTALLVKGAPNPYSAMLLLDFILSKEGQATLEKADYLPAHPDATTSPALQHIIPKKAGLKENFITPQKLFELNDKAEASLKKYFKN
ncbi:MAG TPA: extracellular solute-binding protein [Alphaproteobacteria bacterium]|jgi:ABC-type Fe3+ transport system substrate-binding protein